MRYSVQIGKTNYICMHVIKRRSSRELQHYSSPGLLALSSSCNLVGSFRIDVEGKKLSKLDLVCKATMSGFEGLFVNQDQAESYAKGRPSYPPILFQMLASLTHQHERAWDVGTGNGQAAIGAAEHYKSVVATDVSETQLSLGKKNHNITYAKMSATPLAEDLERIVGPEGSIDLVTVATALLYFDLDKFYPVVKHVLRRPGGVLAAWNYSRKTYHVSPEFDAEFDRWIETILPYSAKGLVSRSLKELPFPFDPVPGIEAGKGVEGNPLEVKAEVRMSFDQLIHMCRSFSPTQMALEQGVDVLNDEAKEALSKAWGPERERTINYIIYILLGTVPAASAN